MSSHSLVDNGIEASLFENVGLRPLKEWKVASFADRKGLFLLPGVLK